MTTEAQSREVAESARQEKWKNPSFMKNMFLGRFDYHILCEIAQENKPLRPRYYKFMEDLVALLYKYEKWELDELGYYPQELLDGFAEIGAFGMKIPTDYSGIGLNQVEYGEVMKYLGAVDANIVALLSAHQSIGVPQPLLLRGSEAQKTKWLPKIAGGWISAFALTEPDVGSDPARLATAAVRDGESYRITGEKLWCTNGGIAQVIVVMARVDKKISAFIVPMDLDGITIKHRCRFMGLRAINNVLIKFDDVVIPAENLIMAEGKGLKIALETLNAGRLAIPSAVAGGMQSCIDIIEEWSKIREQWGKPIRKHEAIAHKIADIKAGYQSFEAMAELSNRMADSKRFDIRIEAAAAKAYTTEKGWHLLDDALQICGGRGYETEKSLRERGEKPLGIERMLRDFRINRIFEGSDEIMKLFIAREAVDKHLKIAGSIIDQKSTWFDKLKVLPSIVSFYAAWYPKQWFPGREWRFRGKRFSKYLRFADRSSRRLARNIFHGMIRYQAGLEKRQAFLFRAVEIGIEIFSMASTIAHAEGTRTKVSSLDVVELHCKNTQRRIRGLFRDLWSNDDDFKYRVAQK